MDLKLSSQRLFKILVAQLLQSNSIELKNKYIENCKTELNTINISRHMSYHCPLTGRWKNTVLTRLWELKKKIWETFHQHCTITGKTDDLTNYQCICYFFPLTHIVFHSHCRKPPGMPNKFFLHYLTLLLFYIFSYKTDMYFNQAWSFSMSAWHWAWFFCQRGGDF